MPHCQVLPDSSYSVATAGEFMANCGQSSTPLLTGCVRRKTKSYCCNTRRLFAEKCAAAEPIHLSAMALLQINPGFSRMHFERNDSADFTAASRLFVSIDIASAGSRYASLRSMPVLQ